MFIFFVKDSEVFPSQVNGYVCSVVAVEWLSLFYSFIAILSLTLTSLMEL